MQSEQIPEPAICASHFVFLIWLCDEAIELIETQRQGLASQTDEDLKIMKGDMKAASLLDDHQTQQSFHNWRLASVRRMAALPKLANGDILLSIPSPPK